MDRKRYKKQTDKVGSCSCRIMMKLI